MSRSAYSAFKACVPVEWSPRLYITLVRGLPGTRKLHRRTLDAMRLRRCHRTVQHRTTPSLLGMLNQASLLLPLLPLSPRSEGEEAGGGGDGGDVQRAEAEGGGAQGSPSSDRRQPLRSCLSLSSCAWSCSVRYPKCIGVASLRVCHDQSHVGCVQC
ncbi:structural constituent of ribosome [Iris pallida]|uniref:Large ribosomal subunit protein uL30m n=1 Tax=Iris pallida TaxID=29817 RepID=A0AAX6GNA9_IRIPA|nr:structural constituent of ribosome [Iris pallida]KAJ6829992.1 structural constituent of ribosome [Iris pallida]